MENRTKAIGTWVLGLYFFPFVAALFFSQTGSNRGVSFAGSIVALSLSGMVLFLTLKKWEEEQRHFEKKYNVFGMSNKIEDLQKELETTKKEISKLQGNLAEVELAHKKAAEENGKIAPLQKEIEAKNSTLIKTQEALLAKDIDYKTQETLIDTMRKDVDRLKEENVRLVFELKTLVRAKNKLPRFGSGLRMAEEHIPEAAKELYN